MTMAGGVGRTDSVGRLKTPISILGSRLSKWGGLPAIIGIGIIFPLVAGNYWIDVAVYWGGLRALGTESEYHRRRSRTL